MHQMDRRAFLRASVRTAAGAALGASAGAASPQTEAGLPGPCTSSAWHKHGIVLEPTQPWEGDGIQNFTTRAEPLKNGEWRIWYSVSGSPRGYGIAYAEGVPGERMRKVAAQCSPGDAADAPFSIGNLPASWKPVQVVHIRLPNGRHRIYFWAHGPQVARYLAAESEDGRRYRVLDPLRPVLYHPNDRASFGVASPDGVVFRKEPTRDRPAEEPVAVSRLISNDATNIYQLPDGSFEVYSVGLIQVPKTDPAYVAHDNAPGWLRVIDYYTSGDGLHLETRRRIIQRDTNDPVDQQFYYLAVTYTAKGRVGMLGHYRCQAQTMDLEWCYSADGALWNRPLRRAWLERGNLPAPDCYGIYSGSQLVEHAGRWHLFYTGVNSSHNGKHAYGKARQVIMYAKTDSIWS